MEKHTKKTKAVGEAIVEELFADYYEPELIKAPQKVFRIDSKGNRAYATQEQDGSYKFYLSCTGLIAMATPTPPELIEWIAAMGVEEAEKYKNQRAAYGTFLHGMIATYLFSGSYNLDLLKAELQYYLKDNRYPAEWIDWHWELKKDFAAFAQFCEDVNLLPIAVELTIASRRMGVAGTADIYCEIDWEEYVVGTEKYTSGVNKGLNKTVLEKKRVRCLIDVKSGRKGFWSSHELQLHILKRIFEENFPEHKIDKVFNWAPKEWRGSKPTYHIKDQSQSLEAAKIPALVVIAAQENKKKRTEQNFVTGIISRRSQVSKNIQNLTYEQIIEKLYDDDQTIEQPASESGQSNINQQSTSKEADSGKGSNKGKKRGANKAK